VLVLTLEKVQAIRAKHENSSLNTELTQLHNTRSKIGFDKLFLDYIMQAPLDQENAGKFEKRSESTRQLKNACIYLLADYRSKNKKPQVNDILQDMIRQKKEQIKMQKQKMGDLMSQ
jgi:hypothetical protein